MKMNHPNNIWCSNHDRFEIISYYYIIKDGSITYYTNSCIINIKQSGQPEIKYIEPTFEYRKIG